MFTSIALPLLLASSSFLTARADPEALGPGPGEVFRVGGKCTIQWTPDPKSGWTQMNIELKTGDNFNMVHLTTVATVDGTDMTNSTYTWTCPNVTPNSAIYFYQFSSPANAVPNWTGRFTIASATGETTPPTNATQPNGDPKPWGTGAFVDPSEATPPPYNSPKGSNLGAVSSVPPAAGSSVAQSSSALASASSPSVVSLSSAQASSTSVQTNRMSTSVSASSVAPLVTGRTNGTGDALAPRAQNAVVAISLAALGLAVLL